MARTGELTPVGHGSFEIAALSAGGVIKGTDAVIAGEIDNCYALVRPPGHHAEADMCRGSCIFGNIAIAVHHCLAVHGMERIAVVDGDVHHGNGTETAFYNDAGAYSVAFEQLVVPALRKFKPQIIFVASGFDASAFDPLGRMMMTSAGYAQLTNTLLAAADELCGGKIVMAHEGGYSPEYVPLCGLAVLEAITGIPSGVEDPYLAFAAGMGRQDLQPEQQAVLDVVRSIHGL